MDLTNMTGYGIMQAERTSEIQYTILKRREG
jgi:hypothetical protein